jgi:hypothetical protein
MMNKIREIGDKPSDIIMINNSGEVKIAAGPQPFAKIFTDRIWY